MRERPTRPEPVRDLDWEPKRAREMGEQALDIWEELLEGLRQLPVGRRETEDEVRAAVAIDVPDEPMPVGELMAYLREVLLEHSMYPGHPAFMAYVSGAGTVPGAVADLLAAAVNQNVGGWRLAPAATEVEQHTLRWLAREMGLPDTAEGQFTTGGAMANFLALKMARDAKAGWDIREDGVAAGPPLALYSSEEVHVTTVRAADMLGLGREAVRLIPMDEGYRMRVDALREAIERDLADGRRPFAVVGTAGTTSIGSIDPLEEIATVCEEHGLWFHVDGAYGAAAVLAPELRPLFAGIERADSIAIDPHKWLYTPLSGGCVLVRDGTRFGASFAAAATYTHEDKELTHRGIDYSQLGAQFSRGWASLKVWVSLLAHGRTAYARRIAHDVDLARYLAAAADARPDFESVGPVTLSIACFRYVPEGLPPGPEREAYLDTLNERLMAEVQLDGRVFYSNAVLGGRFVLRACIVNFRTEAEDLDRVLDVTSELGERLDAELRSPSQG